MTTILLIRHAVHSAVDTTIVGRKPGAYLTPEGKAHAETLADRLCRLPIRAVYSSPLERSQETALPLATRLRIPSQVSEALTEIHYGDWTGRTLEELESLPRWKSYNTYRSGTPIPNGEMMLEAQLRIVEELDRLRHKHGDSTVAVVTHGDMIRSAVAYFLGVPLDLALRIEVSPASVTTLRLEDWGPKLLSLNVTVDLALQL